MLDLVAEIRDARRVMLLRRSGFHQRRIVTADRLGARRTLRTRRTVSGPYLAQYRKFSDTNITVFFLTLIADGENFGRRQLQHLTTRPRFALLLCCSIVQRCPIGRRIGNKPSQFIQKVAFLRLCHILPITSSWHADSTAPHGQSLTQSPNSFCFISRRCCASSDSVAVGRASKRGTPMGSPVSSQ